MDVLDRYYQTALHYNLDTVVRITSDCPLIEPTIIDLVVTEYLERVGELDYASNIIPLRTWPRGLDTEVMSVEALARAWRESEDPDHREHVTPYIYSDQGGFSIHSVEHGEDLSHYRWTLDTREDREFLQLVFAHFARADFGWGEVVALLERNRDWMDINRDVKQK